MPTGNRERREQAEESVPLTEASVIAALTRGKVVERGLLPYSSNHSFLVVVKHEGLTVPAVYKPQRGESPLWDFEWGTLCRREVAAHTLSSALGWNLVPPTVLRTATHGLGSIQFFVQHDADQHYFTVQADARFAPALRRLALFDLLINNADRKSGHCLIGDDERLWAIDHGVCFHADYKLRTVIWEFADEPIGDELLADLVRLRDELVGVPSARSEGVADRAADRAAEEAAGGKTPLADVLCTLLSSAEQRSLLLRVQALIEAGRFPAPNPHRRNYPWPPV
jgi:hypothetical protein